jgi:hypothetical protein
MVTFDMAIAELGKKGLIEREAPAPRPPMNGGTTASATAAN